MDSDMVWYILQNQTSFYSIPIFMDYMGKTYYLVRYNAFYFSIICCSCENTVLSYMFNSLKIISQLLIDNEYLEISYGIKVCNI